MRTAPKTVYSQGDRFRLHQCFATQVHALEEAEDLRDHGYRAVTREYEKPHRWCVYKRKRKK